MISGAIVAPASASTGTPRYSPTGTRWSGEICRGRPPWEKREPPTAIVSLR